MAYNQNMKFGVRSLFLQLTLIGMGLAIVVQGVNVQRVRDNNRILWDSLDAAYADVRRLERYITAVNEQRDESQEVQQLQIVVDELLSERFDQQKKALSDL